MRFWFLFCVFIFACVAGAADLAVPSPQCRCDPGTTDKLEGPGQINFGAYLGTCFDTCRFRKSVVLAPRSPKLARSETLLSNYMHRGAYWTARVPVGHVKNVQVGFEEFMAGIYHVFLIFQFNEKSEVVLSPQGRSGQPVRTSSLVISPEGIPPQGGKYNLVDAYLERYPIGIRALSTEQVIEWSVEKLKHKVRVYDLNLTASQSNELLKLAIESLGQKSFQVKYGLLSNNCATNVLDMIDSVVQPDTVKFPIYYSLVYRIERALPIAGPLGTFKIFLSRNLISDPAGRPISD